MRRGFSIAVICKYKTAKLSKRGIERQPIFLEESLHGKEREFFKEQEHRTVSQEAKYELQVQDGIDRLSLKDRFHYNGMYWH